MSHPPAIGANHPLPPENLMYRVAGTPDPDWFQRSGALSVEDIRAGLRLIDRTLDEYEQILDFGCGSGRVLFWLADAVPSSRLHGVDIDAEAVGWLAGHLPEVDVLVSNPLPPLPFPDGFFDLIHCHSVLTHLDEDYQDAWLHELRRITKPGATLLISVHGQHAFAQLEALWKQQGADPLPLRHQLQETGTLYIADDEWKDGPFPDFYHTMFHSDRYIRRHWGKYFAVRAHIPRGSLGYQDVYVLENTSYAGGDGLPGQGAPPFPPLEFRRLVGLTDEQYFDNPTGRLVFDDVPAELYRSIFDFGCGCGRTARQLLLQNPPPERYVGVDIHPGMIAWCSYNLAPYHDGFEFHHHDVYNLGIAPANSLRTTAPFPVSDGEFTLVNAHSVFTHILKDQTEFYLREIKRILDPRGLARTTWFFFDKDSSFRWLQPHQVCLFVNELDATNAVIYDRRWFAEAVAGAGLAVIRVIYPDEPGHQWQVHLVHAQPGHESRFPLGEEGSEWVCGASRRPIPREFWDRP